MKKLVFAALLLATPAVAQQQASPEMQAVQQKLLEEYNQNLQLRTELIKAQAKLKDLMVPKDDKTPEPKK
jgi:hypothetical protein